MEKTERGGDDGHSTLSRCLLVQLGALCSDQNNAVGTFRAINDQSGRIFQHGDPRDI